MSSKKITLSSARLKNIVNNEEEFTFIFENKEVKLSNAVAEFISPKVSNLHRIDPTINTLHINLTNYENNPSYGNLLTEDIINIIKSISSGDSISLTEEQSNKMRIISIFLGNDELLKEINTNFPLSINLTNIDRYLQNYQYMHYLSEQAETVDLSAYTASISSIFFSIDKEKLFQIPKPILYSIISNEHLKIESEDSLFEFIDELFDREDQDDEESPSIVSFLEQVLVEFLSSEKLHLFLSKIRPCEMTEILWQNLCRRLENGFQSQTDSARYVNTGTDVAFDGNESNRFRGIVSKLTRESGGNVSEKGVVEVTASSFYNSGYLPKNVVDLDDNNKMYFSKLIQNSWIKFDFKKLKVNPTHYSIRSHTTSVTRSHLREWVIEGSNTDNDNDWVQLDSRKNDTSLNDFLACNTFQIQEQAQFFRYLRLRQTGLNNYNQNYLAVTSIEFFGRIK